MPTPALFLAHGSPSNIVLDNAFTRFLDGLGAMLPRPSAILAVSAHWTTEGTFVTAAEPPKQIYDFFGFPDALYKVQYPAPGSRALAERIAGMVPGAAATEKWGLDHGTWSLLYRLFPVADIPVLQLSLDAGLDEAAHLALAGNLAALRDEDVLVVGSGDVVHSLREARFPEDCPPAPWAVEENTRIRALVEAGDAAALAAYPQSGQAARRAVPTNEHYLPLLYALGLRRDDETVTILHDGIQNATISMLCCRVG